MNNMVHIRGTLEQKAKKILMRMFVYLVCLKERSFFKTWELSLLVFYSLKTNKCCLFNYMIWYNCQGSKLCQNQVYVIPLCVGVCLYKTSLSASKCSSLFSLQLASSYPDSHFLWNFNWLTNQKIIQIFYVHSKDI